MRRRELIALAGSTAIWPLPLRAQQSPLPVIGWLGARAAHESAYLVGAFRQGLKEAGFVESQNVALDFRWGEGDYDRLPAYAMELARRPVMVIVATGGDPAAQAAKAATTTIVMGVPPALPGWQ